MLGDISPQTIRLTAHAVVYPGRDHVVSVLIEKVSGRRYVATDITDVTRAVLVFPETSPVIAYDSLVDPVFTFGAGGVLEIDLSDYAMPASIYASHLILFDIEHPDGQVVVDNTDTELVFDFRNVSTTGDTPPPTVEYVTEAPEDGEVYGRQDGEWVITGGAGESNTGANVGGGTGLFAQKSGVTLQFKSLVEGDNVSITSDATTVTLAADVSTSQVFSAAFGSTALVSGGQLSINADTTKFDVALGKAVFADYTDPTAPVTTLLNFGAALAITVTNLASANVTYVGINSSGVIVQQTTQFTNTQRRSIVSLGVVVHSNRTTINAVNTIVSASRQLLNQFGDGIRAIGQLNLSGNVYGPVGASLQILKSAGELFSPGANFHVNPNDPHSVSLGAVSPVTFRYRLQDGDEFSDVTSIDPNNYDNAGTLTAVGNNKFTIQLIALFQSGITRVQYGQAIYNNLADAVAAAQAQSMVLEQNIAENGVVRGLLVVKKGATNLTVASDALFISLSKFSALAAVAPLSIATTDDLAEGTTNFYHTAARVLATVLAGLSTATTTAVTAADTILVAIGKLAGRLALKEQILTAGTNITIDRTDPEAPIISAAGGGAGTDIAQSTRTATTVLVTSSTGADATLTAASITEAGVMVAADKSKLDDIEADANNYSHPNHSGDVTSVGDGAQTIVNDAVTNAKLADMATQTIKGRNTAGTGDPEDLSATTVRTIINVANGATANDTDINLKTHSIVAACSDETTALTTGTAKVTFRMPYAFTLTGIRASLTTAQTSGSIFTVDVNEAGTTILSTKLTIDNTEKTSTTAAAAPVISDTSLADDAEITIDIDQVGDGTAKGLKVSLIGYRT